MTWALIVVMMWLALAAAAALVIGRSICMADRQDAGETEQPNTVQDGARGVTGRRVRTGSSRRHGGNLAKASAALPTRSGGVTAPTLTRSG